MIRINLLPHREQKRIQRRRDFYTLCGLAFAAAVVVVLAVVFVIEGYIGTQQKRNDFIRAENTKLDEQIKEIAVLEQEIDALKARQKAVEDLQSDRNLPVHMLDELVKQMPEGIFLRSISQDGMRVALAGQSQSNERVSELLRNLGNHSEWLEAPELIEIRLMTETKDGRRLYAFTVNVSLKRPTDEPQPADATPAAGQSQ